MPSGATAFTYTPFPRLMPRPVDTWRQPKLDPDPSMRPSVTGFKVRANGPVTEYLARVTLPLTAEDAAKFLPRRMGVLRGRSDRETGLYAPAGVLLGYTTPFPEAQPFEGIQWDVSAAGQLALWEFDLKSTMAEAARVNPDVPYEGRVRVWPAGAAGKALVEIPVACRVGWVGFTEAGNLLVSQDGKFAVWDPATGAKLRDLPTRYSTTLRPVLSPRRNWVVALEHVVTRRTDSTVRDPAYLELFDAETGRTLGRLDDPGAWSGFVFNADASRMTAHRPDGINGVPMTEVVSWNLRGGRRQFPALTIGLRDPAGLCDIGGDRALLNDTVLDLPAGTVGNPIAVAGGYAGAFTLPFDNRLWFAGQHCLFTAPVPETLSGTGVSIRQGTAVQFDLANVDPAWRKPLEDDLTAKVAARGATVGPGGWTIAVTTRVQDWGAIEFPGKKTVGMPSIEGTVEFRSPEGYKTSRQAVGNFIPAQSSYYVRTQEHGRPGVMPRPGDLVSTTFFNFRGQEPHAAMLAEVFPKFLAEFRQVTFPTLHPPTPASGDLPRTTLPLPENVSQADSDNYAVPRLTTPVR